MCVSISALLMLMLQKCFCGNLLLYSQDLEAAGIAHHSRRGSDKCSQLSANVDDIIQAFVALDSANLITGIYS